MGQTLSEPITAKQSSSLQNKSVKVGSSSMQGTIHILRKHLYSTKLFFVKTKEFLFQHYILTNFSCCSLKFLVDKKILKKFVKMLWLIKKSSQVTYEWSQREDKSETLHLKESLEDEP